MLIWQALPGKKRQLSFFCTVFRHGSISFSCHSSRLCELSVSLRSFTYCSYAENPQTLVHPWDGASREKKGGEKLGW